MVERILPPSVAVVATRSDLDTQLFPDEERMIRRAVEGRRREFVTARACARGALSKLGLPLQSVPAGPQGVPIWPKGVVGSITHCAGYRAAAVGESQDLAALGIDAEPDRKLRHGVIDVIASSSEVRWVREYLRENPEIHWDRLLFCVKEAVFKAWFSIAAQGLGFKEVKVEVDRRTEKFSARLALTGQSAGELVPSSMSGRWLAADGLIATAIAIPQLDR